MFHVTWHQALYFIAVCILAIAIAIVNCMPEDDGSE